MYKFNEYYIIKENYNQLKSIVKSKGDSKDVIDNGYGTPTGVPKGSDDYQLLSLLISPDDNFKTETTNPIYGDIPVNIEKEKTMRPFLGLMAKMYYEEKCDLSIIKFLTDWILNNKQHLNRLVIKNNKTNERLPLLNLLDIFKYKAQFNDGRPAYEILTDAIRDKGGSDNVKNWINRLPSILKNEFKDESNYEELYKLVKTFETISKEGQLIILTSLFGDGVKTGKVSRFKNAYEFLKALEIDIKNFQSDYSIDIIKNLILNTKGAKLIVEDYENNYLIADIWDYNASNILGEVNNWCISYSANHWYDNYMKYNSGNKMFFIWNFNVDVSDKYSHLGLCIEGYGSGKREIYAFHDKYDNSINLEVLRKLNINIDFINTQKISDEEYEYKKKSFINYDILKNPFSRWIDKEEAKTKTLEIIKLYNNGDIDDSSMFHLWQKIFSIYNYESRNLIINLILKKCKLNPVKVNNKILNDYITHEYEKFEDVKKLKIPIIQKFFELYGIGAYHINVPILNHLYKYANNIYNEYFNNVKNIMKNYSEHNDDVLDGNIITTNIEKFITEDYDLLLDYIIKIDSVDDYILPIHEVKDTIISDLMRKDYSFKSEDIYKIFINYDYDLTNINISSEELDKFFKKCENNQPKFVNIENVAELFKVNNKEFYVANDSVKLLDFFLENNVNFDEIKWHLTVDDSDKWEYQKAKHFLERNDEKINIYQEYKKGNIEIESKGFYGNYIINYIYENELPIEESEMFLDSLLNRRKLKDTPIRYVKDIVNLMLKYDRKINADIAKLCIKNNTFGEDIVNVVINNLDYTEDYSYNSGSHDIIEELLSFDSPYADIIISKFPKLESYDMDEVGIHVKNVRIINKLLDICKNPKKELLYYILNYAYEIDNKEGDVGDNEETITLIDRLISKNYKFNFESNYYSFYIIFEKCSLYLLKRIIEKKYFDIKKLDIKKVCINILKQNDIDLYNYFKSILPKNSFKIEYLDSNPKKEIIDDILTWDSENFMNIFNEITNSEDYIYYYDKFYPKMSEDEKETIIYNILNSWTHRSLQNKTDILNHLMKYEDNKKFVEWNWDENKRKKNYTDEIRTWIKNYLNPPKVRVKKIKEMFSFNFTKIKKA